MGAAPGKYGFHVHSVGDMSSGCTSAKEHYNPTNKSHGAPSDANRHVGDLGNVNAGPDGQIAVSMTDSSIQLWGPHSIIGMCS